MVYGGFDDGREFGDVLHFAERDRRLQTAYKAVRIALGGRYNAGIVEGDGQSTIMWTIIIASAQTTEFAPVSAVPCMV